MKRAPIHVAAEFDRDAIAKLLLDKGATISCKDTDGFTPIHIASQQGSINTLGILLKQAQTADILAKNNYGQTASDIAMNIQIRQQFEELDEAGLQSGNANDAQASQYSRTVFNGVLMHHDRINTVHKLMMKSQHVGKQFVKNEISKEDPQQET